MVPGEESAIYADGFTNATDIAFERGGSLLVLEIATNSLLSDDLGALLPGALWRLKPDSSRETLLNEGLIVPTSVAIGKGRGLYISNRGVRVGDGEVIRITLDEDDCYYKNRHLK